MVDEEGKPPPPVPSAAAPTDDGAGSDTDESGGGKMFFTTSDLIARINQSVAEVTAASDGDPTGVGGFELRRQMPDGSTRRADEADTAVADLQSKIKQTAAVLSALNAEEKLEWARHQRAAANRIFKRGEYAEAMDVYITCLVAMDKLAVSADADGDEQSKNERGTIDCAETTASAATVVSEDIQRDIQLPVLLNLALCALKLGMLRKAESFCNIALQLSLGANCPKAHFRRGRARMLMSSYEDARIDLERALELLLHNNAGCDGAKVNESSTSASTAREAELKAVEKELQKLERLENMARKHKKEQKKAMSRLWGDNNNNNKGEAYGGTIEESISASVKDTNELETPLTNAANVENQTNANVQSEKGLYSDVRERRQFSTLRAKKKIEVSGGLLQDLDEEVDDDGDEISPTFFQWYLSLFERCLRKTLHILGDEEGARMEYASPHNKVE